MALARGFAQDHVSFVTANTGGGIEKIVRHIFSRVCLLGNRMKYKRSILIFDVCIAMPFGRTSEIVNSKVHAVRL